MSAERTVRRGERLRDVSLQEQPKATGDRERVEAWVRDELGYDFTQEEMQRVIFERNPEMTDEELEAVIGDNVGVAIGGLFGIGGVTGIGVAAEAAAGLAIFGVVAAGVAAA